MVHFLTLRSTRSLAVTLFWLKALSKPSISDWFAPGITRACNTSRVEQRQAHHDRLHSCWPECGSVSALLPALSKEFGKLHWSSKPAAKPFMKSQHTLLPCPFVDTARRLLSAAGSQTARMVRVMPNTPCLVGETASAMCLGGKVCSGILLGNTSSCSVPSYRSNTAQPSALHVLLEALRKVTGLPRNC